MITKMTSVTFDCAQPAALSQFWSQAIGATKVENYGDDFSAVETPAGFGVGTMFFAKVPEDKMAKNRCHIDLQAEDRDAEVARLSELGASIVDKHEMAGAMWTVLQDPEGNEFCVSQAH